MMVQLQVAVGLQGQIRMQMDTKQLLIMPIPMMMVITLIFLFGLEHRVRLHKISMSQAM